MTKVSVIVPAYNLEAYVGDCLLSLLTQRTDFSFEVVVANDASTDSTRAVIAALQPQWGERLQLVDNPHNLGLVATMGRLLAAAKGDYIAYVDGDDLALPGKLQAQADYLDQHPGCAICYHESEMFDSASGQLLKHYSRDYYNAAYIPQRADISHLIRYGVFLQASSVMIRRHGQLPASLDHGCRIICDYPWHIANAHYGAGSVDRLDAVLGRYRIHGASFGAQTSRNLERRIAVTRELERACTQALAFGVDPQIVAQGVSHHRFSAALYFLRLGEDLLFQQLIDEAECDGWYFDERHRQAWELRQQPAQVRALLGFCQAGGG